MNSRALWIPVVLLACASCSEPQEVGQQQKAVASSVGLQPRPNHEYETKVGKAPAVPEAVGASGSLVLNDRRMPIKGGYATWEPRMGFLQISLFPFEVTREEAETLSGQMFPDLEGRPNPDPEKFKACPYGVLRFMFSNKESPSFADSELALNVVYQSFTGNMSSMTLNPPMSDALRKQLAGCSVALDGDVRIALEGSLQLGKHAHAWSVAARLPVIRK